MELRWKRRVLTVTWRLLSCRRPRGLSSSSSAVSPDLSFSNLLMLAGLANRSVHRLHSNFVANFPFPLRVCLSPTHTRQLVIGWYLKNKNKNKKVIQGVYSPRLPPPAAGDRSRCPESHGAAESSSLSLSLSLTSLLCCEHLSVNTGADSPARSLERWAELIPQTHTHMLTHWSHHRKGLWVLEFLHGDCCVAMF